MVGAVPFYVYKPHFFANPVFDTIRVICVVAAVLLVMWMGRVVVEEQRRGRLQRGQVARFGGLALAAISIAYTEVIVQGTPVTWRLPINLAAIGLSFYGLHKMRQEQKHR